MQYALVHQDTPDLIRVEVAQALRRQDRETIQSYVERGDIVNARNAPPADDAFCVYCGRPLCVAPAADAGGSRPNNSPHFEHQRRDAALECVLPEPDPRRHAEGKSVGVAAGRHERPEGQDKGIYSNPDY